MLKYDFNIHDIKFLEINLEFENERDVLNFIKKRIYKKNKIFFTIHNYNILIFYF